MKSLNITRFLDSALLTILFSQFYMPEIPEQKLKEPEMEIRETVKSIRPGSAFGTIVCFLPCITSAHVTVMAKHVRRNEQPKEVITTLSSVNSSSESK